MVGCGTRRELFLLDCVGVVFVTSCLLYFNTSLSCSGYLLLVARYPSCIAEERLKVRFQSRYNNLQHLNKSQHGWSLRTPLATYSDGGRRRTPSWLGMGGAAEKKRCHAV